MKKITSVCPYCGAGCKLKLVVENNKIIRAEAADGVTNQNQLCLKGYYGWDFLNDTQLLTPRLQQPMIRYQKGGKFTPVSWDEAIRYTAKKLREIKEKHGPRAIMTTGSSRGTGNETNYVMQKFARGVLHTNNVDCCARVCHGPSVAGHQADQTGEVGLKAGFKRGIAGADFVLHPGGFKTIEVGVLNIQKGIRRLAALVARQRRIDTLVNPRGNVGPVSARRACGERGALFVCRRGIHRLVIAGRRQPRQYVFELLQQRRHLISHIVQTIRLGRQRNQGGKLLINGRRVFCRAVLPTPPRPQDKKTTPEVASWRGCKRLKAIGLISRDHPADGGENCRTLAPPSRN